MRVPMESCGRCANADYMECGCRQVVLKTLARVWWDVIMPLYFLPLGVFASNTLGDFSTLYMFF